MKRACFFGIYDRDYCRNAVIARGLESDGYSIVHCNVNPRLHKGIGKYLLLIRERVKLRNYRFDFVFVAFPGYTCVLLARILFPKTLLVFDVALSIRAANVEDRKLYGPMSPRGLRDFFLDWHSIRCADIVVLDSLEHIKVFGKRYGLPPGKTVRVLTGSAVNAADFSRIRPPKDRFIVHFHGSFLPQHGIRYVLQAARILQDEKEVKFRLIGGGQSQKEMVRLAADMGLANVAFTGRLPEFSQVLEELAGSHVSLGLFGEVERAQWVIVNKVVEAAAFGKAVITEKAPAMDEVFTDGKDVLLCEAADADDLAEKILKLKNDRGLLEKLGHNAKVLFDEKLRPEKVIVPLSERINSWKA